MRLVKCLFGGGETKCLSGGGETKCMSGGGETKWSGGGRNQVHVGRGARPSACREVKPSACWGECMSGGGRNQVHGKGVKLSGGGKTKCLFGRG